MVEAIATDGIGVIDTFVTTVRTIAHMIEAALERGNAQPRRSARGDVGQRACEVVARGNRPGRWAAEMLLGKRHPTRSCSPALSYRRSASTPTKRPSRRPHAWRATFARGDLRRGPVARWRRADRLRVARAHRARHAPTTLRSDRSPAFEACELDEAGACLPCCEGTCSPHLGARASTTSKRPPSGARTRGSPEEPARRAARRRHRCSWLPAADANWLWTIHSRLPHGTECHRAAWTGPRRACALVRRGQVLEAVKLGVRHGLYLTGTPSSFGEDGATLRYLGEVETVDGQAAIGRPRRSRGAGGTSGRVDRRRTVLVSVLEQEIGPQLLRRARREHAAYDGRRPYTHCGHATRRW